VVAHLHYVLVGINVFGVSAGLYYWFPKLTGRMTSERLGRWSFWVMFLGFNLGFFPMHISGLLGMPRRIVTYPSGLGWDGLNLVTTIGALVFAGGVLLMVINLLWSLRRGAIAGPNPWDGPTLEWATPSPPPPYNFEVIPTVRSRYPLWEGRLRVTPRSAIMEGPALDQAKVSLGTSPLEARVTDVLRMPEDSLVPLLLALSLTLLSYGLLARLLWLTSLGAGLVLLCIIGWLWPAPVERSA